MSQKVEFRQTLRIATMRIRLAESWGAAVDSVQCVAEKVKPRSYSPRILRGAPPVQEEKEVRGTLGNKTLGWDGAFNGIPDGSTTLLAL